MTLTALLLVGGLSQRMGTDKAEIVLDGQPLWQKQLRLLREMQPDAIWISSRTRPAWCPPDIHVVQDEPPSRGPMGGIAAALACIQTTHLLALAVDLPQMTLPHLQKLWALASPGCGVMPQTGGRFEPLCAIYPIEARKAASDSLAAGDLSLQHLARDLIGQNLLRNCRPTRKERAYYLNANTRSDLSEITSC